MTDLVCVVCLLFKGEPKDAETIINGYAVCIPHVGLIPANDLKWAEGRMSRSE